MSEYLNNKVKCNICNQIIESRTRNDFKFCDCGSTAIDGGISYLRRIGRSYEELSVKDDKNHETRRSNMVWGNNFDKNMIKLPKTEWILIKNLSNNHIKNILKIDNIDPFYKQVFKDELSYRQDLY